MVDKDVCHIIPKKGSILIEHADRMLLTSIDPHCAQAVSENVLINLLEMPVFMKNMKVIRDLTNSIAQFKNIHTSLVLFSVFYVFFAAISKYAKEKGIATHLSNL